MDRGEWIGVYMTEVRIKYERDDTIDLPLKEM